MVITRKWLHDHGTRGCGWTRAQLMTLGVTSHQKGWLSKLVGTEITDAQRVAFEEAGAARVAKLASRLVQAGGGR